MGTRVVDKVCEPNFVAPACAGIHNEGAVEYVHDISMRAKDSVFHVMNHARRRL